MDHIVTVGRRKTSKARIFLSKGSGNITVNNKKLSEYFGREVAKMVIMQPLETIKMPKGFDIKATVTGGGSFGQAGAIQLGISRALVKYDESFKSPLKKEGFLTRDSRQVERQKCGQPGARKKFQFSKR